MRAAAEEEVATVSEKNAIVQVYTYGGFIPPTFQAAICLYVR